jgi:hypothetical protein
MGLASCESPLKHLGMLRLLLDHDGYLPSFAVVTEGKYSELNVVDNDYLAAANLAPKIG